MQSISIIALLQLCARTLCGQSCHLTYDVPRYSLIYYEPICPMLIRHTPRYHIQTNSSGGYSNRLGYKYSLGIQLLTFIIIIIIKHPPHLSPAGTAAVCVGPWASQAAPQPAVCCCNACNTPTKLMKQLYTSSLTLIVSQVKSYLCSTNNITLKCFKRDIKRTNAE